MKKHLLLFISVFIFSSIYATNHYWVGGTGDWSDTQHWSLTSNGNGGASVPSKDDNVFFDSYSFSAEQQTVMISFDAVCNNISWETIDDKVIFASSINQKLTVYGSFISSNVLSNFLKGQTVFASSEKNNTIRVAGNKIIGDWIFSGTGSWNLTDDILMADDVSIKLVQGSLNTNGNKITCGNFIGNSSLERSLDLSNSEIYIKNSWDFSSSENLLFNSGTSRIIFEENEYNDDHFKSKNLKYNSISPLTTFCTPSGTPCSANLIITLTQVAQIACNGGSTGSVTVSSVTGGSGTYTYLWDGVKTTQTYTGLNAGTYTVKVTDVASGLFCFCSISIAEPAAMTPYELSTTQPTCAGFCDASSTVDAVGGTFPYTFTWSPISFTGATASNLCAGTYTVSVKDSRGCTSKTNAIITITNPPALNITVNSETICSGQSATLTATGGTTYVWSNGGSTTNPLTVTPGISTTYTVTGTTSGCTASGTASVTVVPIPTITVSSKTICSGSSISLVAGGGTTYLWSTGSTKTTISVNPSITSTFTVTGTTSGCSNSATAKVTVNPTPTLTVNSPTICLGQSTNLTASGATSYVWSDGSSVNPISVTPAITTTFTVTGTSAGCTNSVLSVVTVNPLPTITSTSATICLGQSANLTASGGTGYVWNTGSTSNPLNTSPVVTSTFTVTGTSLGCTSSSTAKVTVNPIPTITVNSATICAGSSASLTASGGTTYIWSTSSTKTTITVTPANTATYTVTGTTLGCSNSGTAKVTVNPTPTVAVNSPTICLGQSTNLTASGATSYLWSTSSTKTTISVTPAITTTFTVTGTSTGCTNSAISVVTVNPLPTITVNSSTICIGQSATLTASGGTGYVWNTGSTSNPLNTSPVVTSTFTVTGTSLGCTSSSTAKVTVNPIPTITVNSATICAGKSASLTASGATTYVWSTGLSVNPLSVTPANSITYTVTGTSSGCSNSTLASVTVNSSPTISVNSSTICAGQSTGLTASGGTTYIWSTSSTKTTITVTPANTTTYTVTGTTTGCSNSGTATVIVNPLPTVTVNGATICAGQSVSLTASGANKYNWSTGSTVNPLSVAPVVTTTYTVTGTTNSGCTSSTTVRVVVTPLPTVTANSTTICAGLSSNLLANGATTYLWSTGSVANPITVTPSITTTYTVTGTVSGCSNSAIAVVKVTQLPTISVNSPSICFGQSTIITATGATSYVWSNGVSANTITVTPASTTTFTVTGTTSGCTGTAISVVTIAATMSILVNSPSICIGASASLTATGASTYVWSTGSSLNPLTVTPISTTSYTVTGTSAGCTGSGVAKVTVSAIPTININSPTICAGRTTNLTATGATSYVWSSGTTTNPLSISPTITTTYSVTGTTAGCASSATTLVTVNPLPTLTVNSTTICSGTSATMTASGATSYVWSTGSTLNPLTITPVGTTTFTVTGTTLGCTSSITAIVIQPNVLNVSLSSSTLLCNGDCNATATATVNGGTAAFVFDWSPGSPLGDGTSGISSLCAGTYSLTVTDANFCTSSNSVTITQPPTLTIVSNAVNVTCFGLCNGSVAVIAGGGSPGYTYSWAPGGETTSSITNQCAGSYTITVRDTKGCTISNVVTITQPTAFSANPSLINNVTCSGACDGSVTATPTGGTVPYTYSWFPGGQTTNLLSNQCAGTYTITVKDSNLCSSAVPITITQPALLSTSISSSTSSCNICNGTATASVAGGSGPYTYLWMPTGQTNQSANGLCPNVTYTITVTDKNNCTASSSVTILPTVNISITTSNTTLSCFGACDGSATASAAGGTLPYNYLWQPGNQTTQTVSNLCAGTYTINASDATGCFNTTTVTFTNPPVLNVTNSNTNASCGNVCDGTATVNPTGGTGAYTYLWMPTSQTIQTATALCVGNYTVTVTDVNGCTATSTIGITQPTTIVDNVTITKASCLTANGSISVAPTGGGGGYLYLWSTGATTNSISSLFAGTYTLTITDNASCSYTFNYILNNTNSPSLSMVHTNVSCNNACDGTATVTASAGAGGYIYDWSPGAPIGDLTNSISSLCGTTLYTVKVTDALGCISLDTATIINPALLSISSTIVGEKCTGTCDASISLATLGGTGSYTYLWLPNGETTSSISNLCAGSYTVTIKDSKNCNGVFVIDVLPVATLSVSLSSTNVICNGACDGTAMANATGGTGAYSYAWSNNAALILPNIVNLCPAQYIVTVTDANNCIAKDTVDITEPTALILTTSQTNISCNGICDGVAVVSASGGTLPYSYLWNPSSIANDTATSLCVGTYNATVTDGNGCVSVSSSVIITEPLVIDPTVTFTNSTCNSSCNGTATSNPTGGTGSYTYLWLPGGQTTNAINNLCAGSYTLTVKDSFSCSVSKTIILTDPAVLVANTSLISSPICNNSCNGVVTANPVGGNGGYNYSWSPGAGNTKTITNACPTTYTVLVTDSKGCTDSQSITVPNPLPIDISVGSTPATCGVCDGILTITPLTGTAPHTYLWSNGQTTATVSNLCAGLYTVTVTDANGCDSIFTIPMNNSSGPTGETVTTTDASCFGICDGSGTVNPIGGTLPYTYLWNDIPGTTIDNASSLCAGNYFVQVTDFVGCIHFSPVTINQPTQIFANGTVVDATCSGICNGSISLSPSGGTVGYTYNWSGGETTASISTLCVGTYTVTITDVISCNQTATFTVGQMAPLTATINSSNLSCANNCNGIAYITITSGSAPYTIQWNDALAQTNDTAFALCLGNYLVTIKDAAGCSTTLNTTINSAPAISATLAVTNATCGLCDGQATLTTSGGSGVYSYLWSANGQTSSTATNLCAGVYSVNITDATGCTTNVSVPVSNSAGPTSASITSTNVTCYGLCNGAVTAITPTGGTSQYTYLWIQSGNTNQAISNLCSGVYYVQITDANGCSLTDSVQITEPSAMLANQTVTAATCGMCDGKIDIAPSGCAGTYAVVWNTGSTASSLTNLCAGIYSVQITCNTTGCSQNVVVPLSSQGGLTLSTSFTSPSCSGVCNGTATVIATGGTVASYLWNDVGLQALPTATGLCAGTYFVQVTGTDNCVSIASATITEPTPISLSLLSSVNPLCNGSNNGSVTAVPSGGTMPYTYLWTPSGQTTATATNLSANIYSVLVTDANGCSMSQTTTLTNPIQSVTANAGNDTVFCQSGTITLSAASSVNGVNYQWFQIPGNTNVGNSVTTSISPSVGTISYYVVVDNGVGCVDNDTINVTSNAGAANAGADIEILYGTSTTIGGNPTGIAGSTYLWNPSTGLSSSTISNPTANPLLTTTYTVTVTTAQGCVATDEMILTILPDVILPNGISPNGDGANDVWIIDNIELFPNCSVEVYNRWGELLFQSTGYTEKWDGNYKGKPLPVGTYYYIIDLHDEKHPQKYTGPITLMR